MRIIDHEEAYPENVGTRHLNVHQLGMQLRPSRYKLLESVDGYSFYFEKLSTLAHIICVCKSSVVGVVRLEGPLHLTIDRDSNKSTHIAVQPAPYITVAHRRQGLALKMYLMALSKYDLISDSEQSQFSHTLWKRLGETHEILTVKTKLADDYVAIANGSWDDPRLRLIALKRI